MSTCNTCGNNTSLPCGCEDIALTMNCATHIGLNCPTDVNQCAEINCMECVVSCGEEDAWAVIGQDGATYLNMSGWNITQYLQSNAVLAANGLAVASTGYFSLLTCIELTATTVKLKWSFTIDPDFTLPSAFQIEYREITNAGADWVIAATTPYGNTSFTISAANVPLNPGVQYQFRMKSIAQDGTVSSVDFQSVWLNVTMPN